LLDLSLVDAGSTLIHVGIYDPEFYFAVKERFILIVGAFPIR